MCFCEENHVSSTKLIRDQKNSSLNNNKMFSKKAQPSKLHYLPWLNCISCVRTCANTQIYWINDQFSTPLHKLYQAHFLFCKAAHQSNHFNITASSKLIEACKCTNVTVQSFYYIPHTQGKSLEHCDRSQSRSY